ncbi:MAG TPA: hypothetical protein ENH01_00315 [Nitrospirae bacterium]|nr:hypothetical protein [Nitrospirota bacterium]
MAYWIQKIQRINKVSKMAIPKKWTKEYLPPDELYIVLEDNGDGTLTIKPLRRWKNEGTDKDTPEQD